jgi:hypothetical protein
MLGRRNRLLELYAKNFGFRRVLDGGAGDAERIRHADGALNVVVPLVIHGDVTAHPPVAHEPVRFGPELEVDDGLGVERRVLDRRDGTQIETAGAIS